VGSRITCTCCSRSLPVEMYYPRTSNNNGRRQPCKDCTSKQNKEYRDRPENKHRKRELSRVYYRRPGVRERVLAKSRKRRRTDHLKYKFGLTLDDVIRMRRAQNDRCAICKEIFEKTPHIDHDHQTRIVRGLLCSRCNTGLGMFREDRNFLMAAVRYLETKVK